ncbi:MAG: SxtJ family membrane protein [Verrucomicrobia subdivision 3 bacterium]|nr:SxtJ family membrane protein [Limisphaerales bacterium]
MLIREELMRLKTAPRDLRKFGCRVGGVFLLLGLWFALRNKPWHAWFWIPGAALVGLGAVAPKTLKHVYIAWMASAFLLGFVVSNVLLTIFFYLVLTPVGLFARLIGKDFLERKWTGASSYWRPAARRGEPADLERQF